MKEKKVGFQKLVRQKNRNCQNGKKMQKDNVTSEIQRYKKIKKIKRACKENAGEKEEQFNFTNTFKKLCNRKTEIVRIEIKL